MQRIIFIAALLLLLSVGYAGCINNNMRAEPYEHGRMWEGWRET